MADDVGVRELRQNLSKYLRKVERGRSLRVLDRGRAVAVLAPLTEEDSGLERWILEGRAVAARGDLARVQPLPRIRSGRALTEILSDLREERLR